MFAWLLGVALTLTPAPPPSPPVAPPSAEEVFYIPPDLQQALHEQVVVQGGASRQQRLSRLVRFMLHPDELGIRYKHDGNYTVAETWRAREGNCLSVTLMTIALARAAGLEAYGQEISRTLTWYSEGDTLYFSNHVNAGVRIHRNRYSVDVASDSVLTGEPPKQVDDARLLAIFYSNRAAALLAEGRFGESAAYMASALRADNGYASAWNNAGVLALRQGRQEEAERHFIQTLGLDASHDGAMMNLVSLYAARGDRQREHQYRKLIEKARQRNPFHYFMLGLDDEKQGDYASAAQHYRRAIALYDGEHRFHHGLARAYLHLGESRKAGDALRRAQSLAGAGASERYQAKLDQLRRKGL